MQIACAKAIYTVSKFHIQNVIRQQESDATLGICTCIHAYNII